MHKNEKWKDVTENDLMEMIEKEEKMPPKVLYHGTARRFLDAEQAWKDGIKFYYGNEKVWLADELPGKYIAVIQRD